MTMLVFATAGKPSSFISEKLRYPQDLPAYLSRFGLNGFEVECGRGFNISQENRCFFKEQSDIELSLHTPYFVSISSVDAAIREKSVNLLLESAMLANQIGAERVIVHSGSCAQISREQALEYALDTLTKARKLLNSQGLENIIICPETMGKINQLGTLDEVLELCSVVGEYGKMLPCVDFGHLNARTHGGLADKSDYAAVFDKIEAKLGGDALLECHIHFSKIEYTKGGEKKHLTFADDSAEKFGPDYKPMLDEIASREMQPFIVCESSGTQAEDCSVMKQYYEGLTRKGRVKT
jgi:deoxyribonuclease-4